MASKLCRERGELISDDGQYLVMFRGVLTNRTTHRGKINDDMFTVSFTVRRPTLVSRPSSPGLDGSFRDTCSSLPSGQRSHVLAKTRTTTIRPASSLPTALAYTTIEITPTPATRVVSSPRDSGAFLAAIVVFHLTEAVGYDMAF